MRAKELRRHQLRNDGLDIQNQPYSGSKMPVPFTIDEYISSPCGLMFHKLVP